MNRAQRYYKYNYLFCISRKRNEAIKSEAEMKNCPVEFYEYDLDNIEGIDDLVTRGYNKWYTY